VTGAHDIVERAQGFVERRDQVGAVDLVEVDVIGPEAFQARFDCIQDMDPRQADGIGAGPHPAAYLGGDDHIAARDAEVLDGAPQNSLGLAFRIDIGGVDEINAGIDRKAQKLICGSLVELADDRPQLASAAEGHRAKANFGNEQAGAAELLVFHCQLVPLLTRGRFKQLWKFDGCTRRRRVARPFFRRTGKPNFLAENT
jgi:hypothetical protein